MKKEPLTMTPEQEATYRRIANDSVEGKCDPGPEELLSFIAETDSLRVRLLALRSEVELWRKHADATIPVDCLGNSENMYAMAATRYRRADRTATVHGATKNAE